MNATINKLVRTKRNLEYGEMRRGHARLVTELGTIQTPAAQALHKRLNGCGVRAHGSQVTIARVWSGNHCKGSVALGTISCNSRLCPNCAPRIALEHVRRSSEAWLECRRNGDLNDTRTILFTPTVRHSAEDDAVRLGNLIIEAFPKMMKNTVWASKEIIAAECNFEVANKGANGLHPHQHIILVLKNSTNHLRLAHKIKSWYERYFEQHCPEERRIGWSDPRVGNWWQFADNLNKVVSYIHKDWGLIEEVHLGPMKNNGLKILSAPEILQVEEMTRGKHLVRRFGLLKEAAARLKQSAEPEIAQDAPEPGATDLEEVLTIPAAHWSALQLTDRARLLRLAGNPDKETWELQQELERMWTYPRSA